MGSPRAKAFDPTVYPVEERVGEDLLQRWIIELLRPLLQRWLTAQGKLALVGADQFIYYQQYDPHKRFSPDLYVLPGVAPDTRVRAWKIWETGIAPSFALEIASQDWEKDYVEAPERCAAAGVQELVVFDPGFGERPGGAGVRWQVFRGARGHVLERVEATASDRVRVLSLGCWLCAVDAGEALRLRIGLDPCGANVLPTPEEAERAAKEVERAAKEAALARVTELEAKLARAGARKPRRKPG